MVLMKVHVHVPVVLTSFIKERFAEEYRFLMKLPKNKPP